MIPYTLAKQLKDAGFPQEQHFYFVEQADKKQEILSQETLSRSMGEIKDQFPDATISWGAFVAIPSLSELIEACGENFQLTYWKDDKEWVASTEIYYDDAGYQDNIGNGFAPDIAAARLWLALNKK